MSSILSILNADSFAGHVPAHVRAGESLRTGTRDARKARKERFPARVGRRACCAGRAKADGALPLRQQPGARAAGFCTGAQRHAPPLRKKERAGGRHEIRRRPAAVRKQGTGLWLPGPGKAG